MNSVPMYQLDPDSLERTVAQCHAAYAQAAPFPHVVIENFLPENWLEAVLEEFPGADTIKWKRFESGEERKLASTAELQMGYATRLLIFQLNSSIFISFLECLTGIQGLVADPHLVGGGLHQIERGGYLKVHADFNWHEHLRLDRRLNLIVYLNKNWKEEYGGHLELWDGTMTRCEQKILPSFNRAVLFSTIDRGYHGHPDPLACPAGETRKSLALYYYTHGRPEDQAAGPHSTIFQARPGEDLSDNRRAAQSLKHVVQQLTPPIVYDGLKRWRSGPRSPL